MRLLYYQHNILFMRAYIRKIQAKKESTRKQILALSMIVSMSLVVFIWVYSLGVRFGNPEVKDQASEDIKPFKLFSNTISDTFKNVGASVGKAPSVNKIQDEVKNDKQVELIPVEYTNQ